MSESETTTRYLIRKVDNGMYGMSPHRKVRGFRKPLVTYDKTEAFTYANKTTALRWAPIFGESAFVEPVEVSR